MMILPSEYASAKRPSRVPVSQEHLLKRSLDIALSSVALLLLSPVFALVAVAIKLDSPGPVIYAQERVGLNRRRSRDRNGNGEGERSCGRRLP